MGYRGFLTGMGVIEDNSDGIIGLCVYSHNNHNYDRNIIKKNLTIVRDLTVGNVSYENKKIIHSNVWVAPWLERGYKVSSYGASGIFDINIFEIHMNYERYKITEYPLEVIRDYMSRAAMSRYHIDQSNIILNESDDIKSLILDIIQLRHKLRVGKDSSIIPSWIQLK